MGQCPPPVAPKSPSQRGGHAADDAAGRGPLTHDDKPHRTTCLFPARTVLDDTVIGTCYPRHRHKELLKFLHVIDRDTSPGQALHLILDHDGRTTTSLSRSGWRDLHDFICTLRQRVPRG